MNKIIMFLFYCLLAVPVHAQTAKVYNFKLVHNFDDNGRKMLKMCLQNVKHFLSLQENRIYNDEF